ncbi:NAD(P)/FAD-dependent oxidoreductase [Paenibacillus cymbidii]|uniref:NAD(P)/FAD-dependent oxidoreductase n=1 Tax=Paenibacillus cymbidii TaxID=1639034 RepID=UPI001436BF3C|nr:NAD(P)/FAD-dependent oxidoreductase [Paenibacillus cymbidii]
MEQQTDVAIVGAGPAGIAAALWCKRLGASHRLIEANVAVGGSLPSIHNPVIDYPGLPAASGMQIRDAFAAHLQLQQCDVATDSRVVSIDVAGKRLCLADGSSLFARGIILATGCSDRRLGVPGEEELLTRGEVYSAARDSARFRGRAAIVVGGGDRAAEGALLLANAGATVWWIHRSDAYRAREEFLQPALRHPGIVKLPFARITEVHGNTRMTGVSVEDKDGAIRFVAADALFVRIGVEPNSRLVRGQLAVDENGFIVTDDTCRTSADAVYAIGDVATKPPFSSIATAVGQGMIAAKQLAMRLERQQP